MANVKITALEHLSSTQVAPADVFVIDQVGPLITRKITIANVTSYVGNVIGNSKTVQANLNTYANYANANAAALSSAIANISANISANFSIEGDTGSNVVVVGVETLRFTGSQGLSTSVGANEVVVSLANTGVIAGLYGGTNGAAIVVPTFTVNSQGRLTNVQNTSITVDLSSIQANIDTVQANVYLSIGPLASLTTASKNNLVSAINEVNLLDKSFNSVSISSFKQQAVTVSNVNSIGAVVFSENKTSTHFAKLLINVEDLTYNQYQTSEILLVQDGASVRIVEYGIIYTSTNPIANFEANLVGSNVELYARTVSADNIIKILKTTN